MINLNTIAISKWFQFPEILITIGVILLVISIILIIIAYLTTDKEVTELDNDSVKEQKNKNYTSKDDDLSKTKEFAIAKESKRNSSTNIDKKTDDVSETKNSNIKPNKGEGFVIAEDDEEDIELL